MQKIEVDVAKLFRLHADTSLTTGEVCHRLGVTRNQMYALQKRYGLENRTTSKTAQRRHDDPSPAEIAERAAWCREQRTKEDRARDEIKGRVDWQMPSYAYDGRECAFHPVSH